MSRGGNSPGAEMTAKVLIVIDHPAAGTGWPRELPSCLTRKSVAKANEVTRAVKRIQAITTVFSMNCQPYNAWVLRGSKRTNVRDGCQHGA
jgi:hypothetical protein